MGWNNVDLSDVPSGRELLPVADYTIEVLPGTAKFGKFDPNAVEFAGSIVGGEFNGKRVFVSFPDPDKQPWSLTAFKRVTEALGVEIGKGEGPIEYLARVAGLRFVLPISIVEKDGEKYQRYGILNPKPVRN